MPNFWLIFQNIVNLLFPTFCISCDKKGSVICSNCFQAILLKPKDKLNTLSVYEYRNPLVNKLLWLLKYHHQGEVAEIFGKPVSEEFLKWVDIDPEKQKIVFIPIPLKDYDKRLHNHASLVAKEISKQIPNSKVLNNFLYKYNSKKQAHTESKHERLRNVENIFYIRNDLNDHATGELKKSLLVIVDDVTTTGGTIWNAKIALSDFLQIETEKILALTIAH